MSPLLYNILVVFYFYMIVSSIFVLLLENRNPVRSLSWILVLVLLPVIGILLYLLIGQNYRKRKIFDKINIKHDTKLPYEEIDVETFQTLTDNPNHLNLINLLYTNSDATVYTNNKIDVLTDGKSTFSAMFDAMKNAESHIHIEFFIFEDDLISNRLRELLIEKALNGVRVRMIYDYFGSYKLSKKYIHSLQEAGVYVKPFLPLRLRLRRNKINFRNHRKLLIVDGKYGFTGGLNFADRYIYGNDLGHWRDTFVRFEGSAVHGLQNLFLTDWYFVDRKLITSIKYYPKPVQSGNNIVQIVSSGPDSDWENIMQGLVSAITSAQKYIYIHTPYYVPNEIMHNSIIITALSGIDVRLMIPLKSDSWITDTCTYSYLGELLDAGVKVYQYQEGVLHSKAIVIDDCISIIGSANLDERSFNQNFEANAFIYDKETAFELKKQFINDVDSCKVVSCNNWHNRTIFQKLIESIVRLFSPIV